MDIVYEDVNEDGTEVKSMSYNPKKDPARIGKTLFQVRALKSCRLTHFTDRAQHKAFKEVEDLGLGGTDEHYLMRKWMDNCVGQWEAANKARNTRPLKNLITYMRNVDKRTEWIAKNRTRLLIERKSEGKAELLKAYTSHKEEPDATDETL